MARSPYAGRRPATASVPRIDEERFVARYQATNNLALCLREFRIGERRGRAILRKNDVEPKGKQRAAVDEKTVLRTFDRLESVEAVAVLLDIGEPEVRAMLDRNDVAHNTRSPVPDFGGKTRAQRRAQQRLAGEPSPSDLLYPPEAARIVGVAPSSLVGRLPNRGTQHRPRFRRYEAVRLRDALRESDEVDGTPAS